jgi:hypothetical protein
MVERPHWRDPILEWRLSDIERRIEQRFRIILAESRARRNVANPFSPVVWHRTQTPHFLQQNTDTTAALIAEIEMEIENEIMEDRLRNSDVVEWSLSPRSAIKIRNSGASEFYFKLAI